MIADLATSEKPSKEILAKLLAWAKSTKYTQKRVKEEIEEFEKSFDTIKNVLEKLDAKCQDLTEPKEPSK